MDQYELLKRVSEGLESLGVSYFVTGSIASILYGEPRFTNDIDIVADIQEKHVLALLKLFPETEFYISEEAIRDAINRKYLFNIIHPASGFKIDIMVRKEGAFEDSRFSRIKRIVTTENAEANFSSPEDLIIMKMKFYKEGGSEKHLRDITGILKISEEMVDRNYIELWVDKLELRPLWQTILKRLPYRWL